MNDQSSAFIQSLTNLLNEFEVITKEERDQAIGLLRRKSSLSAVLRLSTKGRCLNCPNHTQYGDPVCIHFKKGDEWLTGRIAKWKSPIVIEGSSAKEISVNGLKVGTVLNYCCGDCRRSISESCNKVLEKHFKEQEMRAGHERQKEAAILAGTVNSTPAKAFHLLRCDLRRNNAMDYLKLLPYKEFLQSRYWEIVRNYVRWKRGYTCELCASTEKLQVHHKTYEHHGEEHDYLDDLILLCSTCHSRHHGKLHQGWS